MPQEVDELFGNLAELKREGLTVIFISHKLDEVRKVADSITVIRRGTTVGEADPKTTTARELAEMMVGSELPSPETRPRPSATPSCCELEGLTVRDSRWPLRSSTTSTLTVREGEVVGIAGVEGNGQAELIDAIMGLRPLTAGIVRSAATTSPAGAPAPAARPGSASSPRTATARACCWRRRSGRTAILGHQTRPPAAKGWFIDRKAARADTERVMRDYDVRAPGPDTLAGRCPAATSRS